MSENFHAVYRDGPHVFDLWFDGSQPIRLNRHVARRELGQDHWLMVSVRDRGRVYDNEALALLTSGQRRLIRVPVGVAA
jgi:hypothetical protein